MREDRFDRAKQLIVYVEVERQIGLHAFHSGILGQRL